MNSHSVRHAILLVSAAAIAATGCLSQESATVTRANLRELQKQGCTVAQFQSPASSARVISASSPVTLPAAQAEQICRSSAAYACTRRIFSPDASDSRSAVIECIDHDVFGRACLEVDTLSFSSKAAALLPGTRPEASLPGGEYNYEEYRCHNEAATSGGLFPTIAESASLRDALTAAYGKCLALGRR